MINRFLHKTKIGKVKFSGYALIYALFILVLVSLFSTVYLNLFYTNKKRQSMIFMRQDLRRDTKEALLEIIKTDFQKEGTYQSTTSPHSKFNYTLQPWGVFNRIEVTGKRDVFTEQYSALLGHDIHTEEMPSLYLDHSEVLKVGGFTKITKKAIVSHNGIERSYINTQSKGNPTLINGELVKRKKRAKPVLPTFNIFKFESTLASEIEKSKIQEYDPAKDYINPFTNELLILEISQGQEISSQVKGHIKLISNDSLVVNAQSDLKHVQLVAPKVRIKSQVMGNAQIFSDQSIFIENDVHLEYPSVLFLKTDSTSSQIIIEENTTIEGVVIGNKPVFERTLSSQIEFRKGSKIIGQVLTKNMNTQFSGSVYGSSFVNTLFLNTKSSIYTNHLLNATLDITKLPEKRLGIEVEEFTGQVGIIQWINHNSL
ncbi:MAG: hypothetical protein ACPGSD_11340 [Flavobacteriales bacterium]